MKVTRFRFRIAEMLFCPAALVIIDGLMHLSEGKPFMSEYLLGGAVAVFFVRGMDALRAATGQWPEAKP